MNVSWITEYRVEDSDGRDDVVLKIYLVGLLGVARLKQTRDSNLQLMNASRMSQSIT